MKALTRLNLKLCALLVLPVIFAASSSAQINTPPYVTVDHPVNSGWVFNDSDEEAVVVEFKVRQEGAIWLRLYFEDVVLEPGAMLRLTSRLDGGVQTMAMENVRQWGFSSAYFNGDEVLVEIVAPPNSGAQRVVVRSVDVGAPPIITESQCGNTDDRLPSDDVRVARLMPIGCTAWMINDCSKCFLTAGHCTGAANVCQFNVPPSTGGGSLVNPPPQDQYSVDSTSMQSNGGQGVGNDWAYFGVFPNSTTGLTAYESQGDAFDLADPPPVSNNDIRITGHGVDFSPPERNQVQQTHVGPLTTSSGSTVRYRADTEGGNSGSPVIWEQTGLAVGIHTHGGCSGGGGSNAGTGYNNNSLQNALANPRGVCECFVGQCPGDCVDPDNYAAGTPGSGGITPQLNWDSFFGCSHLGNSVFTFVISDALNNATGSILIGFSAADDSSAGWRRLVDPVLILSASYSGGSQTVTVGIPNNPFLLGLDVYCQGVVIDAGAANGVASTNGMHFEICR